MASTTECAMPYNFDKRHLVTCVDISKFLAKGTKYWDSSGEALSTAYDQLRSAAEGSAFPGNREQSFYGLLPYVETPAFDGSEASRAAEAMVLAKFSSSYLAKNGTAAGGTVILDDLGLACQSLVSAWTEHWYNPGHSVQPSTRHMLQWIPKASSAELQEDADLPKEFTQIIGDSAIGDGHEWHREAGDKPVDLPPDLV